MVRCLRHYPRILVQLMFIAKENLAGKFHYLPIEPLYLPIQYIILVLTLLPTAYLRTLNIILE